MTRKHPMDEMAEKAPKIADVRKALEGDFYTLHYLKQPEALAPWVPVTEHWPTREEAEAKAEALREGRHASISIKPRRWE